MLNVRDVLSEVTEGNTLDDLDRIAIFAGGDQWTR